LDVDRPAEVDNPGHHLGVGVDEVGPGLLAGLELPSLVGEAGLLLAQVTNMGVGRIVPGAVRCLGRGESGLDVMTSPAPTEDALAGRLSATQRLGNCASHIQRARWGASNESGGRACRLECGARVVQGYVRSDEQFCSDRCVSCRGVADLLFALGALRRSRRCFDSCAVSTTGFDDAFHLQFAKGPDDRPWCQCEVGG
jgi:hypothetical protein